MFAKKLNILENKLEELINDHLGKRLIGLRWSQRIGMKVRSS
jgi:hypothetical protein